MRIGRQMALPAIVLATLSIVPNAAPPFTVVLIPDTQYYSRDDLPTYKAQMTMIGAMKPAFAIHLGDITHDNTGPQWANADAAHDVLDGFKIPYTVVPGNHDYPHDKDADPAWPGSRTLTEYTAFANQHLAPQAGTSLVGGSPDLANTASKFDVGELPFFVIGLEFAPQKDAVCWADSAIAANPQRRTIIATHCYNQSRGQYVDCDASYNLIGSDGNVLWEELVERHSNVFAAVAGHINGTVHRVKIGRAGNAVHEILTDYQMERFTRGNTVDFSRKNGNGWLRTLDFDPAAGKVRAKVVTPLGAAVKAFNQVEYSPTPTDPGHTFEFDYDMSGALATYAHAPARVRFHDRTVNDVSSGNQRQPGVAMGADGKFVSVWEDNVASPRIRVRGFRKDGCESFPASFVDGGNGKSPDIAMTGQGKPVVVWVEQVGGADRIRARILSSTGSAAGAAPITVATPAGATVETPRVAADQAGNFVVVWTELAAGDRNVRGRLFSPTGAVLRTLQTSSATTGTQAHPDVGINAAGEFVLVWEDDRNTNQVAQVRGRRYAVGGTPVGTDFTVNSASKGEQLRPRVALAPSKNFVIVWQDDSNDNNVYETNARGLNWSGAEVFHDITVNDDAGGDQLRPDVAVMDDGSFVVTWQDGRDAANQKFDIRARGFDPAGNSVIHDFRTNSLAQGVQGSPAVTAGPNGLYVVIWEDDANANGKYEVVARGLSFSEQADAYSRPSQRQ